jgi:high-affinity iron transporter
MKLVQFSQIIIRFTPTGGRAFMVVASLITLREGLEAALIVSILLGYLRKVGHLVGRPYIAVGIVAAGLASTLVAAGLQWIGVELEGTPARLFEVATMLLAVALLSWMVFWMRYQSRTMKSDLEREISQTVAGGHLWGLASLAFLAVLREGIETGLFLTAAAFASGRLQVLAGGLVGLVAAIAVGWLFYSAALRLKLRSFFDSTSALLLLFAAGMMAQAAGGLQAAGLLPVVADHIWNTNGVIDETGSLGGLLHSLLGHEGSPSLLEVLAYWSYWLMALVGMRWGVERRAARLGLRAASSSSGR